MAAPGRGLRRLNPPPGRGQPAPDPVRRVSCLSHASTRKRVSVPPPGQTLVAAPSESVSLGQRASVPVPPCHPSQHPLAHWLSVPNLKCKRTIRVAPPPARRLAPRVIRLAGPTCSASRVRSRSPVRVCRPRNPPGSAGRIQRISGESPPTARPPSPAGRPPSPAADLPPCHRPPQSDPCPGPYLRHWGLWHRPRSRTRRGYGCPAAMAPGRQRWLLAGSDGSGAIGSDGSWRQRWLLNILVWLATTGSLRRRMQLRSR